MDKQFARDVIEMVESGGFSVLRHNEWSSSYLATVVGSTIIVLFSIMGVIVMVASL